MKIHTHARTHTLKVKKRKEREEGREWLFLKHFLWYQAKSNKAGRGKVLASDYVSTFIQSLYRSMADTWSIVQSTTDQNKTGIPEHLGISLVSVWCSLCTQMLICKHSAKALLRAFWNKESRTLNVTLNHILPPLYLRTKYIRFTSSCSPLLYDEEVQTLDLTLFNESKSTWMDANEKSSS